MKRLDLEFSVGDTVKVPIVTGSYAEEYKFVDRIIKEVTTQDFCNEIPIINTIYIVELKNKKSNDKDIKIERYTLSYLNSKQEKEKSGWIPIINYLPELGEEVLIKRYDGFEIKYIKLCNGLWSGCNSYSLAWYLGGWDFCNSCHYHWKSLENI